MTGRTPGRGWDASFWRGKRILLTGHTGFKGAWLAAWLRALGAEVSGFSLAAPHRESLAWNCLSAQPGLAGIRDMRGDICDATAMAAAVARCQPEIVFHLAAQALVLDSYAQPMRTWQVNVMGTFQLLEALREAARPATVVAVTSDKCYENSGDGRAYRETDPLGGHDPYSASKGACEILLSSWSRSFSSASGVRLASGRAGNVIGGGDNAAHRIVPDLMQAFAQGVPAIVRNPHSTRPYQHVLEPLGGYLLLARSLHEEAALSGQAYNFGPAAGEEKRTGWLAEAAAACWGKGARVRNAENVQQAHEAPTLMLDSSKAGHDLGWTPRWNVSQAISATVDWHKAFMQSPPHAGKETLRQIALYESHVPYAAAPAEEPENVGPT